MNKLKQFIENTSIYKAIKRQRFPGSANYWEDRYSKAGNSGGGSYNRLAEFKAEILNSFVKDNNIKSVIEFGCGDGNQLALAHYPPYIGFDVSKTAIKLCMSKFKTDPTKSFFLYDSLAFCDNNNLFKADLSLSLDVIYHLVEDDIFEAYMTHLFNSSKRFVIIYSSNFQKGQTYHEKDRDFTTWVDKNKNDWRLLKKIDNKYKAPKGVSDPENKSKADFYIYEK